MVMESVKFAVGGDNFAVENAINEVMDYVIKNGGKGYKEHICFFDGSIYLDGKGSYGMEYNIGELPMLDDVDKRLGRKTEIANIFRKYVGKGVDWFTETI